MQRSVSYYPQERHCCSPRTNTTFASPAHCAGHPAALVPSSAPDADVGEKVPLVAEHAAYGLMRLNLEETVLVDITLDKSRSE